MGGYSNIDGGLKVVGAGVFNVRAEVQIAPLGRSKRRIQEVGEVIDVFSSCTSSTLSHDDDMDDEECGSNELHDGCNLQVLLRSLSASHKIQLQGRPLESTSVSTAAVLQGEHLSAQV
jgi:hypothetical protein